jgi:ubiquinone/menaquinone biosynthesis C-methylase UbiE
MLEIARRRLGDHAQLDLADAADMPYEDDMFDLVICRLLLHEFSYGSQSMVLNEVKQVNKVDGRILLINFQPGPSRPLQGWISKTLIIISELAAGGKL